MIRNVLRALRATLALLLLTGVIYPLAMTGIARIAFPGKAEGSLLRSNGRVVGSGIVGQQWNGPQWFYGRPSVASYDGTNSGGSNQGPLSKALADSIHGRADAIMIMEGPYHAGLRVDQIPPELLLASASGLDPDISLAAAEFQVPRIAAIRKFPQEQVDALVRSHVHGPPAGLFGARYLNVLELNEMLEAAARS